MASGDTLLVFTPLQNEPPDSDFATIDLRNNHPVLDFDATTDEYAVFRGVMPRNYSGSGITVYIHYAMSSATSGDVGWYVSFERIGDQQQDIDGDSFAQALLVEVDVPGTSGLVDIASVAFNDGSQIDNIQAGEGFRLRVQRDADGDSAVGDAELLVVELKEA
ncbi:MAG TPA: hypothetical protein HPP87_13115 [Planctomycetes bacterium]|nr:hypothetical protein [Planctomycetota bacterium]